MGKLFGSSGVRGLVNSFLTPELACKVGMAVAAQCHVTNAVVARDTRVSGPMLEDALVAGLTASGVNVQLVGVVPTPAAAYLTRALAADVGFMLTASLIRLNTMASKSSVTLSRLPTKCKPQ
jgi:phosphoglucosamine mutase